MNIGNNINSKYDSTEATKKHITQVGFYITKIIDELLKRIKEHDQSKLSEPEKSVFDSVTPKLKGLTYGSAEYKESLKELGSALTHHYKNNRHHPEYFKNGIMDMNIVDIAEMLCDWGAATARHSDGDIIKSLNIKKEKLNLSDELYNILLNTIRDFQIGKNCESLKIKDINDE